jgi:hypothetical protein
LKFSSKQGVASPWNTVVKAGNCGFQGCWTVLL